MGLVGGGVGLGEPFVGFQAGLHRRVHVPERAEAHALHRPLGDLVQQKPPDVGAVGEVQLLDGPERVEAVQAAPGQPAEPRRRQGRQGADGEAPEQAGAQAGHGQDQRRRQQRGGGDAQAGLGLAGDQQGGVPDDEGPPDQPPAGRGLSGGVGRQHQADEQGHGAQGVLVIVDGGEAQVGHRGRRGDDPGADVDQHHDRAGPGESGETVLGPGQAETHGDADDQADQHQGEAALGGGRVDGPGGGGAEPDKQQQHRPQPSRQVRQRLAPGDQDGRRRRQQAQPDPAVDRRHQGAASERIEGQVVVVGIVADQPLDLARR